MGEILHRLRPLTPYSRTGSVLASPACSVRRRSLPLTIGRKSGSRTGSVRACQVLRPRRVDQVLALALLDILPSTTQTVSAPGISFLSRLNGWPASSPTDASPWSSPSPTQHSLPIGRYPLPGPDFHRLDPASFAWRTSGRGASYPAPPPQIPPCGFPAVGSRRRSNAIEGKELGSPTYLQSVGSPLQ